MKVVALAGGVGGAKLVHGLAHILPPDNLTVIVNTGDDFEHLGLKICPDLDTVCYTLAGIANPETGWGLLNETWNAINNITSLGGPGWFRLGDLDLGTHLERTRRLMLGQVLSKIIEDFCRSWNIETTVLPMSNDPVPTIVQTNEGDLPFQEYFVHRRCEPRVKGFIFLDCEKASPAPGIISALMNAELLVICPSNPWVSIDPILSVPTIKETIIIRKKKDLKVLAVSPIVSGRAIKGPLAKMFTEMSIESSALSVAKYYINLIDFFVFDLLDKELIDAIEAINITPLCFDTVMKSINDRNRLAKDIISYFENLK